MFHRKSKKILVSALLLTFLAGIPFASASAVEGGSEEIKVDYDQKPIIDSDLDGLTDQGEIQIYRTDPANPDTDGDGFYDGMEVLRKSDPLEVNDPVDFELADRIRNDGQSETSWAWYVTRAAGIIAFIFLWLSVFLGLSIRNNLLKRIIQPVYSFEFHCFLAASSLFWALIHGMAIVLDKFFGMGIKDVMVPFHFNYPKFRAGSVDLLALGIIAFYLMVVLVFTSYFRKYLSPRVWRILHFLNPLAFIFVVLHGLYLGTDLQGYAAQKTFLLASLFLVVLYLSGLFSLLWSKWKKGHEENID